jgi:catechol 2,3-dioxygenase-like lactoylglutathione lyase family enzyme
MLDDADAIATLGVKDLGAARDFYERVLGLDPTPDQERGTASYLSGRTRVLLYESQFAGTNRATAVTWIVGAELEAIIAALKSRGATFEHYDLPGTTREADVHVTGHLRLAWLKDPDGNILALVGTS